MLYSLCQQIWKTQQWPQDWKRSVFIPIPKATPKNVQTTAQLLSFHMLEKQCSKWGCTVRELLYVQVGLRKGRGTRDQIADIQWIIKKARKLKKKNTYFCFIDYAKAFECLDHNKLWKILQEMGTPDHLTCLLRNLYSGQEATVRTRHGTTDWFQIEIKAIYCHIAYLTSMQSISYEMPDWMKHKLESRWPGVISVTSDMQMTPLYGRKWRRTKDPLDESEGREWKSWLKTQHSEN